MKTVFMQGYIDKAHTAVLIFRGLFQTQVWITFYFKVISIYRYFYLLIWYLWKNLLLIVKDIHKFCKEWQWENVRKYTLFGGRQETFVDICATLKCALFLMKTVFMQGYIDKAHTAVLIFRGLFQTQVWITFYFKVISIYRYFYLLIWYLWKNLLLIVKDIHKFCKEWQWELHIHTMNYAHLSMKFA